MCTKLLLIIFLYPFNRLLMQIATGKETVGLCGQDDRNLYSLY